MVPKVPFARPLYPPSSKPTPPGVDIIAVKRAVSRAGFWPWQPFDNLYSEEFAMRGVKPFQQQSGLSATGNYGSATHEKLRNTRRKNYPNEWAFDQVAISLMTKAAYEANKNIPLEKVRAILSFCYLFDAGYDYGGEHDESFLDDDPHDGFDCSSSVSYVLWKFDLLGANKAQVSSWFESYGEPGRGQFLTIHANLDHVWMEFNLPEGYFRFDTSPHGDGPRGPRVRTQPRWTQSFIHRHPKGL